MVSRIGLAGSLGWFSLILDRYRAAACPHPDSSSPFIGLGVGEFNFVLSVEVTGAFGADADYQARERLVLEFVLIAFSFGVSCLRFSYNIAQKKQS